MPAPADGGVGSPAFPVNLTAGERAHLAAFDVLDFEVFSRRAGHDWVKATPLVRNVSPGANERDQEHWAAGCR